MHIDLIFLPFLSVAAAGPDFLLFKVAIPMCHNGLIANYLARSIFLLIITVCPWVLSIFVMYRQSQTLDLKSWIDI